MSFYFPSFPSALMPTGSRHAKVRFCGYNVPVAARGYLGWISSILPEGLSLGLWECCDCRISTDLTYQQSYCQSLEMTYCCLLDGFSLSQTHTSRGNEECHLVAQNLSWQFWHSASSKHLNPQHPSRASALLGLAPLMRKQICQVFNTFERVIAS